MKGCWLAGPKSDGSIVVQMIALPRQFEVLVDDVVHGSSLKCHCRWIPSSVRMDDLPAAERAFIAMAAQTYFVTLTQKEQTFICREFSAASMKRRAISAHGLLWASERPWLDSCRMRLIMKAAETTSI